MQQTNRKCLKFVKRLIYFASIQLLIALLFFWCLHTTVPIQDDQIEQATVLVTCTTYRERPFSYRFVIYSGSESYHFENLGVRGTYSNSDLYESIKEGDIISLEYIERDGIFDDKTKWVISAHTETKIYRTVEEFNGRMGRVALFVMFGIIEILFLFVFIIFLLWNRGHFPVPKRTPKIR